MNKTILKNLLLSVLFCISLIILKPSAKVIFSADSIDSVPVQSKDKLQPIYRVKTNEKKVSLTFNAIYIADNTDILLDVLKDNDVKATFFLVGDWVRKYPDEAKKLLNAGHDIGNHSNKHLNMSKLSREEIKRDIIDAHNITKEILGIDMNLFRAPYGEYNDSLIEAAKECGYHTVQWDIDTLETKIEVNYPTPKGVGLLLYRTIIAYGLSIFPYYFYLLIIY